MFSSIMPMAEGRLRRAMRRLTTDDDDLAAEDLQQQVHDVGATPICDCAERAMVTVFGTVKSVTLRPLAGVPALEVELFDGTANLFVVWLGRRQIAGIRAGVTMLVSGRIGTMARRRTMFNPTYTIVPASD